MKKFHLLVLALLSFTLIQAQVNQEDERVARGLISKYASEIGLSADDLNNFTISSTYETTGDGIRMVYLQQTYLGIPVHNQMQVLAFRYGKLLSVSGGRISQISQKVNQETGRPQVTVSDAVRLALADAKLPSIQLSAPQVTDKGNFNFGKLGVATYDIIAERIWVPVSEKEVKLAWEVELAPVQSRDHWMIRVDALSNEIISRNNYTVYEHFDEFWNKPSDAGHHDHGSASGNTDEKVTGPLAVDGATYRVIPYPAESPIHAGGAHALRSDPWNLSVNNNATSLKWHYDGTTYHDSTRGNNVWAQEDRDNNNTTFGKAGYSSTAQPNLTLDYTPNYTLAPTVNDNQQFAITNLFYWNNIIHDITYAYGFDEPSGNFQASNQGRGGAGNDYVIADAQDAGGTNNANFSTPTDGNRPRMQMYLWTSVTPNKDGDLDNGIIAHEYGHGVSNRLTGGPSNTSCLSNAEQGGEGWSDFLTLMTTTNWATAQVTDGPLPRSIGTYALNQSTSGGGIRFYPYSTNMAINPWTYANVATNTNGAVHTIGEIWCTALWEMTWELIAQDGINPNIYDATATGGNSAAFKLVIEGMRLQPCSPGFIDARNAILQADAIHFNGRYNCAIWRAFAKRGMGTSASQGSSNSYTDQVAAFDSNGSLSFSVSQSITAQQEGLQVTYTNRVVAPVCGGISNYLITDTLPSNVTYVSGGNYNSTTRVVSFDVTLAASQVQDYSFTVSINPGSYFPPEFILNEQVTGPTGVIPTGWTATSTTTSIWTTHNTRSKSAPNSFFTPNRTTASDQRLITSAPFTLSSTPPELSFWHWYNSEGGWDGGVVEISTNGGTSWTDLGPYMTSNGYNGTLGMSTNALSGRSAFNGNSGQFIKTTVNMTAFANQTVSFRFRFGSDGSVAVTGWNIDDIIMERIAKVNIRSNIFNNTDIRIGTADTTTLILPNACLGNTISFTEQPANTSTCENGSANFSVTASGSDINYQWQVSIDGGISFTDIDGENTSTLTLASVPSSSNNNRYRCIISNECVEGVESDHGILTVNNKPQAPLSTNNAICGSGSMVIAASAGSGETVDWYADPTGGVALASGTFTFNTGNLTSTTIFYAQSRNTTTGCISSVRTPVTATVNSFPAPPSPSGGIPVCGSGTINLTAIPGQDETIDWYATETGSSALLTGSSSYTTTVISSSTTYYAATRNLLTGCVSEIRSQVIAVVNSIPSAPSGTGNSRCGTGSVTISATPNANETIDWYVVPTNGIPIQSGSLTYITGTLSANVTYYAAARNLSTGCVSATRTPVSVTILQTSSSTTSISICESSLPYEWNGDSYSAGGTYSVTLTNALGCDSIATLLLDVAPGIIPQTVTGGGSYTLGSGGVPVGLAGSENGISYQLIRDGNVSVGAPIIGTNAAISFGNQLTAGVYSVLASSAFCQASMLNSVTITVTSSNTPLAFNVTGGGTYCQGDAGIAIGLDGSEAGIQYQLFRNTTIAVGSPVTGTGSVISFGLQTISGTYSVIATNTATLVSIPMLNTVNIRIAQIKAPSAPGAVTGPTDVCLFMGGAPVTYSINQASNATSYVWTAPNGATIIGSNTDTVVTIFYPNTFVSGTLSVVSVNACFGNATSSPRNISISRKIPTTPGNFTSFIANPCALVGSLSTADFAIRPVLNATGYDWTLSPGITLVEYHPGDTGVTVRFNAGFTTGSVSVKATNACWSSAAKTYNISTTIPSTPGSINGLTAVCAFAGTSNAVTYSINPVSGAASYQWTLPANASIVSGQGTTSVDVLFTSAFTSGTISVRALSACGNSGLRNLSVSASKPSRPVAIDGLTQVCDFVGSTSPVSYSIAAVSGAGSYNWTVPANVSLVSGQGTTTIQVLFLTNFESGTISVVAEAACGNSSARSLSVSVTKPTTPVSISGPTQVCPFILTSGTATYTIDPVAGATSYLWVTPANSTIISGQGSTSIDVTFSSAFSSGNVTVRAVSSCGSSSTRSLSLTKQVTRPGAITASGSPCPSSTVTYTVDPVANATNYVWNLPTNAIYISGQGTTSYTISFKPAFSTGTLSVKTQNGCNSSAASTLSLSADECLVSKTMGVKVLEDAGPDQISIGQVYPNPNKGQFNITVHTGTLKGMARLQLIDMFGKVVWDKSEAVNNRGLMQLPVNNINIPSGIYELKFMLAGQTKTTRVIIAR